MAEKIRCSWCTNDPLYTTYHDEEWGTPLRDDRALFELLCLEGQQAGLSWITVLRKREHYRKLFASIIPGYITTIVGFGLYALLVNLIVSPKIGYWFFPTTSWWLLIVWVLPPFLAITLSLVLRLSSKVKSTAAAQQATGLVTLPLILIAYGQSTGALASGGITVSIVIGLIAWAIAALSLLSGVRSIKRGQLLGVADGS